MTNDFFLPFASAKPAASPDPAHAPISVDPTIQDAPEALVDPTDAAMICKGPLITLRAYPKQNAPIDTIATERDASRLVQEMEAFVVAFVRFPCDLVLCFRITMGRR